MFFFDQMLPPPPQLVSPKNIEPGNPVSNEIAVSSFWWKFGLRAEVQNAEKGMKKPRYGWQQKNRQSANG